jgi:hypothetical protein
MPHFQLVLPIGASVVSSYVIDAARQFVCRNLPTPIRGAVHSENISDRECCKGRTALRLIICLLTKFGGTPGLERKEGVRVRC